MTRTQLLENNSTLFQHILNEGYVRAGGTKQIFVGYRNIYEQEKDYYYQSSFLEYIKEIEGGNENFIKGLEAEVEKLKETYIRPGQEPDSAFYDVEDEYMRKLGM